MSSKNTIEVPVELIEAGDIDAIRKLVPVVEGLLGRWATHPARGRVLIVDNRPGDDGMVGVAFLFPRVFGGARRDWVPFDSLTLDPVELTTEQDFQEAPEGTIVNQAWSLPREKCFGDWINGGQNDRSHKAMAQKGTWQVLHWGEEKSEVTE